MKRTIIFLIITILCVYGLLANADDFILGSYGYLQTSTNDFSAYLDYLQEANYNSHVCWTDDQDISELVNDSQEHSLQMILQDHYDDSNISLYDLTRCNYYKYEAEYSAIDETFDSENSNPNVCPSMFYYRMPRDSTTTNFQESVNTENNTGYLFPSSNSNAWECEPIAGVSSPSYAAQDLLWKWEWPYGWKYRGFIGKDVPLAREMSSTKVDTFFYNYSMYIDEDGLPDTTKVCRLGVYALVQNPDSTRTKIYLPIQSYMPNSYADSILTVADFANAPQSEDFDNYKTFTFYTLKDDIQSSLIDTDHTDDHILNINFELYWYNNAKLLIDYFEIYDDVYKRLDNGDYDNYIASRSSALNCDAVDYIYLNDEPYPPELESLKLMKDKLNMEFTTAVHRIGSWAKGVDPGDEDNEGPGCYKKFDNHKLFSTVVDPDNISFDKYPINRNTKWNVLDVYEDGLYYAQGRIDQMLYYYKDIRVRADILGVPFYAIPQTYGVYKTELDNDGHYWDAMRPPTQMQKCLQYLPLCYDVDGIIDYRLYSSYEETNLSQPLGEEVETDERANTFTIGLIDREGNTNSGELITTSQFNAIKEANEKILFYAEYLKDSSWNSAGVGTINSANSETELNISDLNCNMINDITVSRFMPGDSLYFDGYVECAEYNYGDEPYYMLVNRRTNFSKPEYTVNDTSSTIGIPYDVDSAFTVADSQRVTFYFDNLPLDYNLVEVYSKNTGVAQDDSIYYDIGPGEGLLLRLGAVVDTTYINTTVQISSDASYINPIVIENGGTLILPSGLKLLCDSSIIVENGGSLQVSGDLKLLKGADLIVHEGGTASLGGSLAELSNESEISSSGSVNITCDIRPVNETWKGISCDSGTLNITRGAIYNAETAIKAKTDSDLDINITYSDIKECDYGIMISGSNIDIDILNSNFINKPETTAWRAIDAAASYVKVDSSFISNSLFGIHLASPVGYKIENTVIEDCGTAGIFIRDSHLTNYKSYFKNNYIHANNYGMLIYNASSNVIADTLYANKMAGILASEGSSPIISNTSISETKKNSVDNPEIKLALNSYPVIDSTYNDIIFDTGYSIENQDNNPLSYNCRMNWWGTTSLFRIENSFDPPSWNVTVSPIATTPNVGFVPRSNSNLFQEGLAAEENGDLTTAKAKYYACIEAETDNVLALWSATRLMNCSTTISEYLQLQDYYQNLSATHAEIKLGEMALKFGIYCNRLVNNYQQAITEYELHLEEDITFLDSLFTQLDIVYTYLDAESDDRSAGLSFLNPKNALSSTEQAKKKERGLWQLYEKEMNPQESTSSIIEKYQLRENYPNPFNPTTNISFSLPEEADIKLNVYNIKGQKVKSLANERYPRGHHNVVWNGKDDNGKDVGSGVYFYRLQVNDKTESVKKCLLLK